MPIQTDVPSNILTPGFYAQIDNSQAIQGTPAERHVALLIGLLALMGTARSLFKLPAAFDGTAERPAAIFAQAATAVLSIVYLALGVRSFIAARRARTAA